MVWDWMAVIVAFAAGVALGASLSWRRRTAGHSPEVGEGPARRHTWRVAAVAVGATLLVAGAGAYVTLRLILRPKPMHPIEIGGAVEQFREAGGAVTAVTAVAAPPTGAFGPPPAGVYSYRAEGFFELRAPVFGNDRRELPPTVPATVLHTETGWSWTVQFFDRHRTELQMVPGPGPSLAETQHATDNEHFSIPVRAVLTCTPPTLLSPDARPGRSWDQDCRSRTDFGLGTTHAMPTRVTLVGVETVRVGDADVPAYHVRRETTVRGSQTGFIHRDDWLAVADGLPLRRVVSSRTGGMAENIEEFRLEIESLTPQR